MKVIITEQQMASVVKNIAQNNPLQGVDMEKEAPTLTSFIKKLGTGNMNTQPSDATTQSPEQFSPNIPEGNDMMHPLGHKGPITSPFGQRNSPTEGGSSNHKGVDISTPSGSPVYAPLDGVVSASRDTTPNACGGFIKLDHVNIETKFCHLSNMVVNPGDKVKKGQLIGHSGGGRGDPHPGISTGPHLHYEILNKGGIAMNPVQVEPNLA